jgi:hypothetical protein
MMKKLTNPLDLDKPTNYRIRVAGELKESWSDWFDGMMIDFGDGAEGKPVSILTGTLVDQSALHGVLRKIRDLGLKLLSVEQIDA